MIKKLLLHGLLILLPFIAYGIYLIVSKRMQEQGWREAPYFWLLSSGLGLFIVSIAAVALFGGDAPDTTYRPAIWSGTEIVPGRAE